MDKFDSKEYLNKMLTDKRKHIQIIANLILEKNYTFENKEQLLWLIKRNVGVARRLSCFDIVKIKGILKYLLETANYKVGLETVEKYIMEDVNALKKEDPLLILKDGEKIYDTERLKKLESDGRIFYRDGWHEKKS
jgi:hypothetical protein